MLSFSECYYLVNGLIFMWVQLMLLYECYYSVNVMILMLSFSECDQKRLGRQNSKAILLAYCTVLTNVRLFGRLVLFSSCLLNVLFTKFQL
jgi:hypothetical protein